MPAPRTKAAARPTKTIRQGAKGAPVGKLQTLLNRHGAKLKVDKVFGPSTTRAVKAFQRARKLTADGVAGPKTWRALEAKTAKAPVRKPAATPTVRKPARPSIPPKPAKKKGVLIREKLVQAELAATRLGIHEVGGNNHGPWVKKFLAETGLPEGYAWCDAFQSYEEHQVAGMKLPIESASVAQTYAIAEKLRWTVATPARGDLFCVNWTKSGPPFGDHIGLVVKATNLGLYWKLQTVEGNTSSGAAGSQGDGDGVFLRTRILRKNQVGFVRIPGVVS